MISITCNQCKTVLTIDDAFAGGVCRCQHCGTIQTVPAHFKGNANPTNFVPPSANVPKNLYQNQAAARSQGGSGSSVSPSGLDELAQVVASSGLGGSGLGGSGLGSSNLRTTRNPAAAQAPPQQQAPAVVTPDYAVKRKKPPMMMIAVGGGIAGLAIVAAIIFFVMRPSDSGGSGGGGSNPTSGGGGGGGPAFCGVPIVANGGVIYVLDRANSIRDHFDALVAATFSSVKSLGPDHKFAVVLWNNGGDDVSFPDQGLRNANSDQVDQLQKKLEGVQATGSSGVAGAMESAIARSPGAIVLVTAKSTLDPKDESALTDAVDKAGGKIKFYVFVIGGADNTFLKLFAKTNGGQYRLMGGKDLSNATP